MDTEPDLTVAGARAAAERDRLADWVRAFLASPGSDNADLADELETRIAAWAGPVELPFDELHRLAGPPDQPTLARLHDDDLDTVDDMEDSLDEGWDPPPLIVTLRHDQLVLEDGNHRIEGLRRAGRRRYWSVVGFASVDDRQAFSAAG